MKIGALARSALREAASVDPRTLGFFRICLALLLLCDLGKRAASIETWYFDSGLLSNAVQRPEAERVGFWSVLWWAKSETSMVAAFLAFALIYLGLLVGWRTKLFQLLALVSIVSLQARVNWLCNGGDFVLCSLCWWTLFLPLGRRFSLDAARAGGEGATSPVVSVAAWVAVAQLALIYFFNGANKYGVTWRTGTAVHYLLQEERSMTAIGLWAREQLPFGVTRVLTHTVRWVEIALPLLMLSPFQKTLCRRLAIAIVLCLHAGFALFANFGMFSPVMCTYAMLLWTADDWTAIEAWMARSVPRRWIDAISAGPPRALTKRSFELPARVDRWARRVGALAIVFPLALAVPQLFVENPVIPSWLRIRQRPRMFDRLVWMTRLRQGWSMFAPNSGRREMSVVVAASTEEGRRVDPIYEAALGTSSPQLERVPVRSGMDVYWIDWISHVPKRPALRRDLRRWLGEYHLRTGRPQDRLTQFTAYHLTQACARPGSAGPTDVKRKVLFRAQPQP